MNIELTRLLVFVFLNFLRGVLVVSMDSLLKQDAHGRFLIEQRLYLSSMLAALYFFFLIITTGYFLGFMESFLLTSFWKPLALLILRLGRLDYLIEISTGEFIR